MKKVFLALILSLTSMISVFAENSNTSEEDMLVHACTLQYEPVCGEHKVTKEQKTFGNPCSLSADKDYISLHNGECKKEKEMIIGGDKDNHGCLTSAGYSWDKTLNSCVQSWETETLFKWAKHYSLTTRTNMETFDAEQNITRQEALAFMYRAFNKELFPVRPITKMMWIPNDEEKIAPEFKSAVNFAKNANILQSNSDSLYPNETISTREALLMIASLKNHLLSTDDEKLKSLKDMNISFDDNAMALKKEISRKDFIHYLRQVSEAMNNSDMIMLGGYDENGCTSGTPYIFDAIKKMCVSLDGKDSYEPFKNPSIKENDKSVIQKENETTTEKTITEKSMK